MNENKAIESNMNDCGLLAVLNGNLSKNEERNVRALILCEETFKVRCAEKGYAKDTNEKKYNLFRRVYNASNALQIELIAKGMMPSRASDKINYADSSKDRGAIRGGYRPESAIAKAHETIRTLRREAFDKSRKEGLLPSEMLVFDVPMTNEQWAAVALALNAVPHKYRVLTAGNNLVHNAKTAMAYCLDRNADITGERAAIEADLAIAEAIGNAWREGNRMERAEKEAEALKAAIAAANQTEQDDEAEGADVELIAA